MYLAKNNIELVSKNLNNQQIEQCIELAETCLRRKFVGFN